MPRYYGLLLIASSAGALIACLKTNTAVIGTPRPARAPHCEVKVVPNIPSAQVEDIATSEAVCPGGRHECIFALKREACKVGANLVYGFREGVRGDVNIVTATLAFMEEGADTAIASSGGAQSDGCNPPCSPGYQCEERACKALCNPVCSPGFACAQDRTCQPEASVPSTASAAQP